MKKLLVFILALVMCLATLVACGEPETPEVTDKFPTQTVTPGYEIKINRQ